MNERKQQENYDPAALADAILLDRTKLPEKIGEDLETLRKMLDDAVEGTEDTAMPAPVPPAYGKGALPTESDTPEEKQTMDSRLILRQDTAVLCPDRMIQLSARRDGEYVTVPQVVRQGGSHG